MAGQSRRNNDYGRQNTGPYERQERRDDRDRPYPERSPYQSRSPQNPYPRRSLDYRNDRNRSGERDIPPNAPREPSHRSPSRGTPTKPGKGNMSGHGTQNTPYADAAAPRNTGIGGINPLTNLICEKVSWMQKKEEAQRRLTKLRADHARSSTKHVDFPSVMDMFQNQIKTATNELAQCNKSIKGVDEKLQSQFGHLSTNQILSSLAGQADAQHKQELTRVESIRRDSTRSEPTRRDSTHNELTRRDSTRSEPTMNEPTKSQPPENQPTASEPTKSQPTEKQVTDVEKQPVQSGTSTSELLNLQLDNKLNELKRKFDSDLQELKTQFEATGNERKRLESENQELRKSHDEMTEKLQQLEGNLDQIERKTDGGVAAVNLRVTAMCEQVNRQLDGMTTEHQPKSEHRPESKHQPESEHSVSDTQLKEAIEQQDGKIAAVYTRIGSALMDIADFKQALPSQLEELRESDLKLAGKIPDISGLNSSVSDHGKRISNQKTTLDTMMAQISSLKSLVSENPRDRIQQLFEDVSAIQKRLDEDSATTNANPMTEEKVHDILKSELANAVERLSDPNPMTEQKVRDILKPELANAVKNLPNQHTPSAESNNMTEERVRQILKPELASAMEKFSNKTASAGPNPVSEEIVREILRQGLADVNERLLKKEVAGAGSNAMTEDKVREILKPELVNAAKKLHESVNGRLTTVADGLGKFIDKERQARLETDGKVSTLADSMSSLQKARDESKSSTDDVSLFRKAVDEAKADQETWKNYTSNQIHEYGREVEGHRNSLSTINSQVEELRDELRRGYEGHQMQLVHLSSWMNTFNTRRMYNEIVAHLNAAQPTGAHLNAQLRTLSERIDGLENREDEGGVKKRKGLNGNTVVVNNSR
ncbi:hypothetical protein BKA56DRAFT_336326 [Ilyonectria sp. MPI-CAGE-AT-0026]|nr:hypothetical protein BKA56DRAFT_336326 [Ilyonectria sp. MPI-CAGE-AT-0026]